MKQHKIKRRVACEGKYKIMVGKKPGGIESEQRIVTDWFTNLITDGGLNHLGSNSFNQSSGYCQVGEGSTTPSVEDVNLTDYVAYTQTRATTDTVDIPSLYQQRVTTYSFGLGVAAGNLTEVGVGWGTSENLFSHALILDAEGSPTSITVLSDEYLTVVYSYRIYGLPADSTGSVTFTGNIAGTYNWTLRHSIFTDWFIIRPFNYTTHAGAYDGSIGIINSDPSGDQDLLDCTAYTAYVSGSLTTSVTVSASIEKGNLASGIKSIRFHLVEYWQVEFDPVIPKTDQDTLSITFEMTWGRK
jgi:hypothetical protein